MAYQYFGLKKVSFVLLIEGLVTKYVNIGTPKSINRLKSVIKPCANFI